jgi:hypothetical protein
LGEKQIDSITEKMDSFRNENIKFKNNMKQKFYDIERRFNETKTGIDTDNHRIKVRVDEQLQDQSRKFEEAVMNSKELVINSVKGDIEFGNQKAEMLRTEVMQLIEQMNNELERKHSKHVNRFESFTV